MNSTTQRWMIMQTLIMGYPGNRIVDSESGWLDPLEWQLTEAMSLSNEPLVSDILRLRLLVRGRAA